MDKIADFVMSRGKAWAFCSAFSLVFVVASVMFLGIYAPFVVFGSSTWSAAISGAVGCGIGSALVNATACAINS